MSIKTKVTLTQGSRVVELELDGTIEEQLANLFRRERCMAVFPPPNPTWEHTPDLDRDMYPVVTCQNYE